jgi:hypothetical protein
MTPEQEIQMLKSEVANLYGVIMSMRDQEVPLMNCGPQIKKEVITSGSNITRDSFDYKGVSGTDLLIYGGVITLSGRSPIIVPDNTPVTVTAGSIETPSYISIKVYASASAWGTYELVNTATYPQDDGTFMFRPLMRVYLNGEGNAVFLRYCRNDIQLRSPT